MDARDCDRRELADALTTLGRVNRYLGGARLACRQVHRLLAGRPQGELRLLDVGAGGGDVALRLSGQLHRTGWSPSFLLADRHRVTLQLCRERALRRDATGPLPRFSFVRLDGTALPFADGDVDIAYSTTTLHHLEEAEARAFVAELARVSRFGWAITDLRRSRPSYALMRALGATVWRRRPLPRADAPVSVLRSFTPAEADRLAREAGVPGAVLERSPLRWALRGVRG
jgi:ubiquinone/menaquinone biosynthesis C-methylase UbiE